MKQENAINNFDFVLPHSLETERCVLGMLLIDSHAVYEVEELLSPEVFYDARLGKIYAAVASIAAEGGRPDLVLVQSRLAGMGSTDSVGDAVLLCELVSSVASSVNVAVHACRLRELYLARRLVTEAGMIRREASDPTLDIADVIGDSIKRVEAVADLAVLSDSFSSVGKLARESVDAYHRREALARAGRRTGIPTGLQKLDYITGGWRAGDLILTAARPSMGKSAFMLHFARTAAEAGTPVVIFSLEMGRESLASRLIVADSGVEPERYKNGLLSDSDHAGLYDATGRLSYLPILVDDSSNLTIRQVKARTAALVRKGKCGLVMVDYLQLLDMRSTNRAYNREQEVAQCTRQAKLMAKELDVPVMLLSQLSRKNEERRDKTPLLSDLRESGAIEQDADIVLFVHRPEYYAEPDAVAGVGTLRIAKQRNGPTGDIRFRYNESLTKISDY